MLKLKYFPIIIIFYMENEIVEKPNLTDRIITIVKKRKKLFIVLLSLVFVVLVGILFLNYYQNSENTKISEKYIKAGIFLSIEDKEKSRIIYKEIISSKNKFYSLLSLNKIIENDLEKDSNEILKLFEVVENINLKKEHKNIIKLKKALYLKKISKTEEGQKLLQEIISNNSTWKEIALEISE